MQRVPFKISSLGRKELLCHNKSKVGYKSCSKVITFLKTQKEGKQTVAVLQKLTSLFYIGHQLSSLGGGEWIFSCQLSRFLAVGGKT